MNSTPVCGGPPGIASSSGRGWVRESDQSGFVAMLTLLVLFACTTATTAEERPLHRFEFTQVEMAVEFRIVVYAPDESTARQATEAAFARVRQLCGIMSDYDTDSELRRLCAASRPGHPVAVSDDLWRVLNQAQRLSELSDGAFDITVGPVVHLWRRARRQRELPPPDRLAEARKLVGYRLVRLIPAGHQVELQKPGMLLDLGGIAKGDAVHEAMAVLKRRGLTRAMIEAGGEALLGDPPPGKPGWVIGVGSPTLDAPSAEHLVLSHVGVDTSGDAFQYVQIAGRRYSHIVDPRTGIGLTDHSKVTVVSPDTTNGDGLSTAISVLGPERGLRLVEQLPRAAALILRNPEGKPLERYQSSRWKDLPTAPK